LTTIPPRPKLRASQKKSWHAEETPRLRWGPRGLSLQALPDHPQPTEGSGTGIGVPPPEQTRTTVSGLGYPPLSGRARKRAMGVVWLANASAMIAKMLLPPDEPNRGRVRGVPLWRGREGDLPAPGGGSASLLLARSAVGRDAWKSLPHRLLRLGRGGGEKGRVTWGQHGYSTSSDFRVFSWISGATSSHVSPPAYPQGPTRPLFLPPPRALDEHADPQAFSLVWLASSPGKPCRQLGE
jgi:hypothetical protein